MAFFGFFGRDLFLINCYGQLETKAETTFTTRIH